MFWFVVQQKYPAGKDTPAWSSVGSRDTEEDVTPLQLYGLPHTLRRSGRAGEERSQPSWHRGGTVGPSNILCASFQFSNSFPLPSLYRFSSFFLIVPLESDPGT